MNEGSPIDVNGEMREAELLPHHNHLGELILSGDGTLPFRQIYCVKSDSYQIFEGENNDDRAF